MSNRIEINVPLPQQSLDKHSLFELNQDSAARWLQSLPSANLGEITRQLYIALVELNKVRCNPKDRLQILDQLRNSVHVSNRGLERHFLNKPIILPEKSLEVAQLADTLNKQMAIGYTITVNQLLRLRRLRRPKDLVARAVHRAITEYSLILLRNFQLYRNEEPGFWTTIHEFFYLALKHKLSHEKVVDEIWGSNTLEQCYLRPMLLFTARPHQLRPSNQAEVFTHLSTWTQKVQVRSDALQTCVFLFNPTLDAPPAYRELCDDATGWLGIDSKELSQHFEEKLKKARTSKEPEDISIGLMSHLHISWSTMLQRHSVRVDRDDDLLLSLGLLSTHYFIADSLPFSEFIRLDNPEGIDAGEPSEDLSLRKQVDPEHDVWADASHMDGHDRDNKEYTPDKVLIEAISYESSDHPAGATRSTQAYRFYRAGMVNASDRGYCIEWPSTEVVKLNTGDVVGLREEAEDNWSVGIIRWAKKVEGNSTQLGLEVLSSNADAYSARKVCDGLAVGKHQRTLMLPPDRASGSAPRIMVQRSAFEEGDSLKLSRPGQTYRIKLQSCLVNTASLGVYEFSTMVKLEYGGYGESHREDLELPVPKKSPLSDSGKKKQEFDHLWEDL